MTSLNSEFPLRDLGTSNALGLDEMPRHRWYYVKEGFSPKLVEHAIENEHVNRGDHVLDPFCGGGTVPLSGALQGLNVRAFEVNPFLSFVSRTKLRQTPPKGFLRAVEQMAKLIRGSAPSSLEGQSTFTRGNRWNRWLFPLPVLRSFEAGRKALPSFPPAQRDLLKLALLGAAMDCCNATRDGKCLRYRPDWRSDQSSVADFREAFSRRTADIAEDLEAAPLGRHSALIARGDARELVRRGQQPKFRLCVTSPPYLNSFDYSDVYRPELFLGSFVGTNRALMIVRLQTVRSHLQANWKAPKTDEFGSLYRECAANLRDNTDELWDQRIPAMVQAYFEDMHAVLRGLKRQARKAASLWLVVSTSAYGGVEIPVDLILAEIGQRAGWFLREVGVLRYLRSSSQHVLQRDRPSTNSPVRLRESVVILDGVR